jgi:uncharacterized protein (UPF0332 family)
MDARDFCRLGRSLVGDASPSEAACRTAVSRAYYGAFLSARDAAAIGTTGAEVHRRTASYYIVFARKPGIGNLLNRLRRARNISDYDLTAVVSSASARHSLEQAERLLRLPGEY